MKKLSILYFAGILLLAASCIDLTDVYSRLDTLEGRMDELTQTTTTANSAFTIANALKDKVYVESVTENADGYVIKFSNGKTASIANGNDGKDATAPTIGVTDGEGGALYWTVNGEVMKDAKGNPVNASVAIPEFKFDNNKWW